VIVFWFRFCYVLNSNTSLSMYLFCNSRIHVITLYSGHVCVYYTSMLRCWHLVWILVKTDHPCLGVGYHIHGLNKKFDHMKIFIKRSQLSPSFHIVRNDLELEKIELDNSTAQEHASAFYPAPLGGGRPSQQQQQAPCPPQ
jgi:hypothetical protein